MELILLARIAALLAGCAAAAYTDAKTGLILDKITYGMIAVGIALNVIEMNWLFLALGAAVFAIGYAVYYAGKIGGGDVKLCTAIAFLLPLYGGQIFIANALFFAALTAVTFYSVFFVTKYARLGINLKENSGNAKKAGAFAIVITAYLIAMVNIGTVKPLALLLLAVPLLLAIAFMAFEKGIRRSFFLRRVALKKLGEDEVIAAEFLDQKIKKKLKLGVKGVFGEKEIAALRKMGVRTVPVYRGMPPFAPFILLGCIVALAQPDLVKLFFI
ncbi:MAG: A24 family peptidase [Candidatus Diapherotrites archaeon]|nr:A24 family peptidase [Candidatus Diapherotrites archaeon]